MNFASDFFNGFFGFLNTLPDSLGIITLIIVLLIFILSSQIKKSFNWLIKKMGLNKRSCGDCILILFGISEKYKKEEDYINRHLLNKKMNYVEQKMEYMTIELTKKYKDFQIEILKQSKNYNYENVDKEFWGYKHALVNALYLFKKNIKFTFLENGFHVLNDKDMSIYVKEKSQSFISTFENFLTSDYPRDNIVNVNKIYNFLDKNWFEDIMFDIYIEAKKIQIEADIKIKDLENKLKNEINKFIKDK
jgi:hypothetical protein